MRIYTTLFLILTASVSMACDVCGCRLGGLSYGILPQHYQHLIGVRYSYAGFNAHMNHDSEYYNDEYSDDTYQRIDLMGRISLLPRLQLNVQLPYLINDMDGTEQSVSSSGIGDPSILVFFTPFNSGDSNSSWKNSLLIGGGVKLPFGEYKKEDNAEIINRNFQLGSGSLDYLLSANFTISYDNWGINMESSYKMNSRNDDDYRFGNQFNISGYVFRYLKTTDLSFLPFAGVYHENSAHHTDGKIKQINTGGSATYATLGYQVYWKQLSFNMEYQLPITQQFNTDAIANIEAENRISLGLIFSITGKKNDL